jgi:hypothetical protein
MPQEIDRRRHQAQRIRVDDTARQNKPIEIFGIGLNVDPGMAAPTPNKGNMPVIPPPGTIPNQNGQPR